ncbi:MAG: ATP-binding protein, partial [Bacteroidales bacterium]|nr:ATP-binding protein [Bacteroidales bacterium]
MKDNPFIITGLVQRPYFCDREKESESIIQTLTERGNITLISARRIGKSKLIDFCFEEDSIKKNYYTFYIDLLHTSSIQELVYAFGKEVFAVLGKRNARFGKMLVAALSSISAGFEYDPVTGSPRFSIGLGDIVQPEYTLEEIFSILDKADKPCIVAF